MLFGLIFIIVLGLVIIVVAGKKKYDQHNRDAGEKDWTEWYNHNKHDKY